MISALILGAAQGVSHCLEPDHLAAVTSLLDAERGPRRAAWLGAAWGLGYALAVLGVCAAVVGLGVTPPAGAQRALDVAVGLLLVGLGVRGLRSRVAAPASAGTRPRRSRRSSRGALLVGVVHGLAGSGALTALVVASLPAAPARLAYAGLFGLGSIAGMALVSGAAGASLGRLRARAAVVVGRGAALAALAVGVLTLVRAA